MRPARALCADCVVLAGVPRAGWPGLPSSCGDFVLLDATSPKEKETVWIELDSAWVWCWNHGTRRVPLVTLMELESSA